MTLKEKMEQEILLIIKSSLLEFILDEKENQTDFDKGYREGLLDVVRYVDGMLEVSDVRP